MAFLGARLRPGVEVVIEAVRLRERMEKADLVVTGEGMFDEQSLHGKAPAGVLRVADEFGLPAVVLCGQKRTDPPRVRVWALADRFGLEAAMGRTRMLLQDLAAEVAAGLRTGDPGA
jgi:glycerate kinase